MQVSMTLIIFFMLFAPNFPLQSGAKAESEETDHLGYQPVNSKEKAWTMANWARTKPLIFMESLTFKQYVYDLPRPYSVITLFTVLDPKRQCEYCKLSHQELQLVIEGIQRVRENPQDTNVFFVLVDFDRNGQEAFQMMKFAHAPTLVYFPSDKTPGAGDTAGGNSVLDADRLAQWVHSKTGLRAKIVRPINYASYARLCGILAVTFAVSGTVFYGLYLELSKPTADFAQTMRTMWGALVLLIIFLLMSGVMFSYIRKVPFLIRNEKMGTTQYIMGAQRSQLGVECIIVSGIYAAVTAAFLALENAASDKRKARRLRQGQALLALAAVAFFMSLLVSIFRMKYRGYPYRMFME